MISTGSRRKRGAVANGARSLRTEHSNQPVDRTGFAGGSPAAISRPLRGRLIAAAAARSRRLGRAAAADPAAGADGPTGKRAAAGPAAQPPGPFGGRERR